MNVVEMNAITKYFGEMVANDHVDFDLRKGEIHALLGENGAGKTTLMRILYGLYKQDSGGVQINGKAVQINSPKDSIANNIGMVTQHFALVPPMTVAENVILGHTNRFVLDYDAAESSVADAARKYGLDINPRAMVRHLSVGQRQRVEILKALYRNSRVLILDEPTAVLIPQEVDVLFETLRKLVDDGLSVVFISHKLDEVTNITNRITILRDGKSIGTVDTCDMSHNQLAALMIRQASFPVNNKIAEIKKSRSLLNIKSLSALDDQGLPALRDINLTVHTGEILGIAGVSGNGQKQLAETLCGVRNCTEGEIKLDGTTLNGKTAGEFTTSGMGRIPEDRLEGVVGELTVQENLALEHLYQFSNKGFLNHKAIQKHANELIVQYQIKARPGDRIRTLSGGNVQKVLLARVLSTQPKIVIAPQPTRGLDVGAADYVRQQLLEQRNRGAGVILISEDLDEILALSDRIAVMYEGKIVGVLDASEANPERLGLLMSGAIKEM